MGEVYRVEEPDGSVYVLKKIKKTDVRYQNR